MLTVEDRLTTALSQLVDAKLAYPLAIIQLRLATGTLIKANQPTHTIDFAMLTTLPSY
jgi:hypothetical protein